MASCTSGPPRLPTFNLLCNIWFGIQPLPPVAVPNLPLLACQLVPGEFVYGAAILGGMFLKVPALTNVQYVRPFPLFGADIVECPAGSAHYYQVVYVNDVGKGFPNEYRFIRMQDVGVVPTPIP